MRDRLLNHRNNLCQLPCTRACGDTVTRPGIAAHERVCSQVVVQCDVAADFGCPWEGPRGEQAAHAAACSIRGVLPALRLMSQRITQLQTANDAQTEQLESLRRANAEQAQRLSAQAVEIQLLQRDNAAHTHRLDEQQEQLSILKHSETDQAKLIKSLKKRLGDFEVQSGEAVNEHTLAERVVKLEKQSEEREEAHNELADRVEELEEFAETEPKAQAHQINLLHDHKNAQEKRLDSHVRRIAELEARLAEHTAPLNWHKLGDNFCEKHGVWLEKGWDPSKGGFRFAKDAHGFVHLNGKIKYRKAFSCFYKEYAVLTLPAPARR